MKWFLLIKTTLNWLTYLVHAKLSEELINFGFSDRSFQSLVSVNHWVQTKNDFTFWLIFGLSPNLGLGKRLIQKVKWPIELLIQSMLDQIRITEISTCLAKACDFSCTPRDMPAFSSSCQRHIEIKYAVTVTSDVLHSIYAASPLTLTLVLTFIMMIMIITIKKCLVRIDSCL